MPSPLVSVVISNYNYGRYCPDALDSVFRQSLPMGDYEILAVDDGSSDDSPEILKRYVPRVKAVLAPHQGQAAALNAALQFCQGRWVSFLEADDVWLHPKLETVLNAVQENPSLAAVSHPMRQADAALNPLPTEFPARNQTWSFADFLAGKTQITGLSALTVRRDILEAVLPFPKDLTTCLDEYLHPRLLASGPILHLREPLGLRRIHGANFYAGMRQSPEKIAAYLSLRQILDRHLDDFLRGKNAALAPKFKNDRIRRNLEIEFFLKRWEKDWDESAKIAARAVFLCGLRPYALFKAASLLCAMISPSLYLMLYENYEKRHRLFAWRARALPE